MLPHIRNVAAPLCGYTYIRARVCDIGYCGWADRLFFFLFLNMLLTLNAYIG